MNKILVEVKCNLIPLESKKLIEKILLDCKKQSELSRKKELDKEPVYGFNIRLDMDWFEDLDSLNEDLKPHLDNVIYTYFLNKRLSEINEFNNSLRKEWFNGVMILDDLITNEDVKSNREKSYKYYINMETERAFRAKQGKEYRDWLSKNLKGDV